MQVYDFGMVACDRSQVQDVLNCLMHIMFTHCSNDHVVSLKMYDLYKSIEYHAIDDAALKYKIEQHALRISQYINKYRRTRIDLFFATPRHFWSCCFGEEEQTIKFKVAFNFTSSMCVDDFRNKLFRLIGFIERNDICVLNKNTKIKFNCID